MPNPQRLLRYFSFCRIFTCQSVLTTLALPMWVISSIINSRERLKYIIELWKNNIYVKFFTYLCDFYLRKDSFMLFVKNLIYLCHFSWQRWTFSQMRMKMNQTFNKWYKWVLFQSLITNLSFFFKHNVSD